MGNSSEYNPNSMLSKVCQIFKAVLARMLFYLHVVVTLIRTHFVREEKFVVYILGVPGSIIILETVFTLYLRRNRGYEWKWFIPCTFLYLLTVVPAIILLEYHKISELKKNSTLVPTISPMGQNQLNSLNNLIDVCNISNHDVIEKLKSPAWNNPIYSKIIAKNIIEDIYYRIDPDLWLNILEQWMLVNLVVGRWLLPRGDLTRDRLSQLLFVYFGIAADIMELFEVLEYQVILMDEGLLVAIFVSWSACLVQFCVTLTAQARQTRVAFDIPTDIRRERTRSILFRTEFWAVLAMMFLQDAPFLCVRLYCMIHHRLFTYNIIFFTVKNALVLALQFYRLAVICYEYSRRAPGPVEHIVLNNGSIPSVLMGSADKTREYVSPKTADSVPISTVTLIKNGIMSPVIIDVGNEQEHVSIATDEKSSTTLPKPNDHDNVLIENGFTIDL